MTIQFTDVKPTLTDADDGRVTVSFPKLTLGASIERAGALVKECVEEALSRGNEVARDAWLEAQESLSHAATSIARADRVDNLHAPNDLTKETQ